MASINDIKKSVSAISSLKDLTSVFEQVASIKMNQIRSEVVERKAFFNDVWDVYSNLKLMNKSYRQEQKDRSALILICSSYGLIGDMNNKIIELAKSDITDRSDIFVIGEKGKDILQTLGIRFFKSYDFEDDVKEDFVREVLDDIKDYTDIKVYYEEFISVSEQNPKKIFLNFKDYSQKFNKKDYSEYLFEPSFKEILEYLESIMVSMMFTQILYESHLSQYAIRMVMMGESSQKASDILLRESLKFSKAKRELSDSNMKVIFTNFLNKHGNRI